MANAPVAYIDSGKPGNPAYNTCRQVLTLNGVDQYMIHKSITPGTITLDVEPISGGNNGLPTGCPALTNGVRQKVSFAFAGSLTELYKNGANFFHGKIYEASYSNGEIYPHNEGFTKNPVAVNLAGIVGNNVWSYGEPITVGQVAQFNTVAGSFGDSNITNGDTFVWAVTISNMTASGKLTFIMGGGPNTVIEGVAGNGQHYIIVPAPSNQALVIQEGASAFGSEDTIVSGIKVNDSESFGKYIGVTSASWSEECV